jgi:secretion/DNA translocation related TadE-like protein
MTSRMNRVRATLADQRGSGTVWVLVATTVLIAGTAAVVAVGAAIAARHRAAAAADLAALAAAHAVSRGLPACAEASSVAAANGTTLVACSVPGQVADVTVRRSLPPPFDQLGVRMRARAGPADAGAGRGSQ